MTGNQPNRLINEKNPYLLQHAYNPVNWYPWGEEAFQLAEKEDKPIFLSIGYSTCHWCHVMEHESFEDPEVAELMNNAFISIKVDREERPDIDNVYMQVCQMLTGSGGWPLTIIMTPDKVPFFAGTYFPKNSRFGITGMKDLVPRIQQYWKNERERLLRIGNRVIENINQVKPKATGELDKRILDRCYQELEMAYDADYGGFGSAPKFPTPHNHLFLLRYWKRTGKKQALKIALETLRKMRLGGIYDHIGYGFHRYSTDRQWLVPHFEKMLYDQALLTLAYTEAYSVTEDEFYKITAEEIITYVLRDLGSPDGGFYSAEDADSEGEEGKFYVWTEEDIEGLLSEEEAISIKKIYNIRPEGNYHEEATRRPSGSNILHLKKHLEDDIKHTLDPMTSKLFEAREKRIRPFLDDKILVDWNGLMIAALAYSGRILEVPDYLLEAVRAAEFILEKLWDGKRLLHRYRDNDASITGFLDDYVFLIWGLIELYESTFMEKYLKHAVEMNNIVLERFWDQKEGGLFFSDKDSEALISKTKKIYDGAIPSGNCVELMNLLRISRLTGDTGLEEKANRLLSFFSAKVSMSPRAYTYLLSGLDFALEPSHEIVIVGNVDDEDTQKLLGILNSVYLPNSVIILKPPESNVMAEYANSLHQIEGKATAYVCSNYVCDLPTNDAEKMYELLKKK